jgi:hypothetical protein
MNELYEQQEPITVGKMIEVLRNFDPNLKIAPVHEEYTLRKTIATSVRIDEDGDVEIS